MEEVGGDTQDEAEHFAVGTAQAETLSTSVKMGGNFQSGSKTIA